jgi:hypothetical protein
VRDERLVGRNMPGGAAAGQNDAFQKEPPSFLNR